VIIKNYSTIKEKKNHHFSITIRKYLLFIPNLIMILNSLKKEKECTKKRQYILIIKLEISFQCEIKF